MFQNLSNSLNFENLECSQSCFDFVSRKKITIEITNLHLPFKWKPRTVLETVRGHNRLGECTMQVPELDVMRRSLETISQNAIFVDFVHCKLSRCSFVIRDELTLRKNLFMARKKFDGEFCGRELDSRRKCLSSQQKVRQWSSKCDHLYINHVFERPSSFELKFQNGFAAGSRVDGFQCSRTPHSSNL